MTVAQVEHVMQPFAQIHNALSRKHAGTGLGLPLTKALIDLHGGTMDIDSRPGVRTTVTVRLPRPGQPKPEYIGEAACPQAARPHAAASPAPTPPRPQRQPRSTDALPTRHNRVV